MIRGYTLLRLLLRKPLPLIDDNMPLDFLAADVVHRCPPEGSSLTPCCLRSPFELPHADRMTPDPSLVTCRRETA